MVRSSSGDRGSSGDRDRSGELFRRIVLPHLEDGLALARWLAGNQPDAEDILQEACLRALRGIGGFRGENPRAWLLAIVRNTAHSWMARQRGPRLVAVGGLDEAESNLWDSACDPLPTPEGEMLRRDAARTVERALLDLPLAFREVVVLRDVNDLTYSEIAALLEVPVGTVMSRLARGRQRLAVAIRKAEA